MPDLSDLQQHFAAALLNDDLQSLAGTFVAGNADAGARLAIFRNNTFISLTNALKVTFPVTMELSDERFFTYAASRFIMAHPPAEARLSRFGAAFPRFLARFEPCRQYPIIAEMAALEWAIADCLHAAQLPPAGEALLESLGVAGPAIQLRLQPCLRYALSRWSILDVWVDHKKGTGTTPGTLRREVTRLAVLRNGEDIQFLHLNKSRLAFWRGLSRGLPLERAALRALALDPLFDLLAETLLLFRMRLVTGLAPTQAS